MNTYQNQPDPQCETTRNLIAAYVEDALSVREAMNIERHLTGCATCSQLVTEMKATVHLLRNSERYDTSHDFMAKLHASLDAVEPEPLTLKSRLGGFTEWLGNSRRNVTRTPALGFGLATAALGLGLLVARPTATPVPDATKAATVAPKASSESLQRDVALSSNNPFDDPAAANLTAHSALDETSDSDGGSL